jgi:hypothetical protein
MADHVFYKDGDYMDDSDAELYALVFWLDGDFPVPWSLNCIDVKNIENPLQLQDPNLKDDIPVTVKGEEHNGKIIDYGRVFMIGGSFKSYVIHPEISLLTLFTILQKTSASCEGKAFMKCLGFPEFKLKNVKEWNYLKL